jgi:hypothetical protein
VTRLSVLPVLIALLINVFVVSPLGSAPSPALALAGSTFDATDGNLSVDGAETDWCSPSLTKATRIDTPSGSNDNSFKASADPDPVPQIDVGSIPNNKVDFDRVYATSETVGGDLFAYVSFIRNDTTGTGTLSFELNQSGVLSSNGVTFQRSAGDLLIEFNFQKSTDNWVVDLSYRVWSGNASAGSWSDAIALGAPLAEGSVNAVDIVDCLNGNNALVDGQFGEFAINLTDLLGGQCRAFGSILAKSRSSNQVTSNLNDLVLPIPVDFSTCGQLTINKVDANQQPVGGATFSISPNPFGGATDPLVVADNTAPDDNPADGVIHLSDVEPGTYEVCETIPPAGYIGDPVCQELALAANGSVSFTFVNTLGAIDWTKVNEQTGSLLGGATFLLEGTAGAATGFSLSVTDNMAGDADPDAGEFLVTGLLLGTYTITETTPPAGYDLPADPSQEVVLSGATASAAFAFEDPPQADASVLKEAVLTPIVAGEDASFDITVTAGGTGTSEDVVLTDLNETGHDWTVTGTDAGDCLDLSVADGETLTCEFGDIPNGESRTITITMPTDVDDCADGIANTASITSSNDHDETNNESSDSIVVLCPNPGVVKEAVASPIVAGEDAVFTITVTAGGTGPAENVVLTDLNDTGHDWTVTGTDAGACADTSVADGETLTCTWAEIPEGESRTITITLTSGEEDCELGLENTVEITADADVDETNNEDTTSIAVLCPDASVLKTATDPEITASDEASFDIVVSAGGSGNSLGVVLEDLNETDHAWTVSGADASACNDLTIDPGETLTCDFGEIPNGQDRTLTITMTSDPNDCELGIENTATISADADVDESNNSSTASIEVLCPDVVVDKAATDEEISGGELAEFTILTSNAGLGLAKGATLTDDLPPVTNGWTVTSEDWAGDCLITGDAGSVQTLTCGPEDLEAGGGRSVTVSAQTTQADCDLLENLAEASASNEDDGDLANNSDEASILVECPGLNIVKTADDDEIVDGEEASFTITVWNALEPGGTALGVTLRDDLPPGLAWDFEVLQGDAECGIASSVIEGGVEQRSIDCDLGDLAPSSMDDGVIIRVFAETDLDDCGLMENTAFADATNDDIVTSTDELTVRCPELVVDKVADAEVITISGPNDALVADPSIVTWTLSYTLTDGPVTNAVITDEVPVGFEFLDASPGGVHADGVVTWTFPMLTESGSVTFRTTVDPETISRTDPTVNTAIIDSDETEPDEGEDSVTVVVEPPPLGGNPTPEPSVPDTAVIPGPNGEPITVPVELLAVFFLGSLGAMALANVRARNRRR